MNLVHKNLMIEVKMRRFICMSKVIKEGRPYDK